MTASFFQDPAGNQLALTAGICGNDDFFNIFSEKLGFHHGKLLSGLADHYQLHVFWHHGKGGHFPFLVFLIVFFRVRQGDKMAKCPGDYIFLSFQNAAVFLICPKDAGNVSCNRRLLCDYQ